MIVLAVVILGAVAVFGTGVARVALGDLALLGTQEAAQRAAEAAAAVAAERIVAGATGAEVDDAARDEAATVSKANVTRGAARGVTIARTDSATELVILTVSLVTDHGGFAGPLTTHAIGRAAVPRPVSAP